jgi:membrane-bound lytic murein transglycosylase B
VPGPTAPPTTATTIAVTSTSAAVATGPPARLEGRPDADAVAAELVRVEREIRQGATTDAERAGLGVEQQLLYRYLGGRPELDAQVLAALPDDVRTPITRVVTARQFAQARSAENPQPLEPTIPAWTVVAPLPVSELRSYYDEAEASTGIPWYWLAAINLQETRFGRIVGISSAGAVGPMQFLPSTWSDCCTGDPTVPRDAILGAATYLARSGGPGDMLVALDRYNPNPSYIAIVTAYAENLRDHPELLAAYHAWQVFVGTTAGTIRLPVGFRADQPVDSTAYLVEHPDDLATVTP